MRQLIKDLIARRPVKAGAFIVTLYGDVVVPRGGTAWIGNVIGICQAVGISETYVRTAVSRLVARSRLVGERRGRLSFYRLADGAHAEFQRAAELIYAGDNPVNGQIWTFVALDGLADKTVAMAELARERFVRISPSLMAAPGGTAQLPECCDDAVVFIARQETGNAAALNAFAAAHWPLDDLQIAYQAFVETFSGLLSSDDVSALDGETSLLARLHLVDQYRKLALIDPGLPADCLPENWAGHKAQALFASFYLALSPSADAHIAEQFVSGNGALPESSAATRRRLETLQNK